ncbi:MAG: hypothetical protein GY702_14980 [Desulfobulbaceae bacterium]|nr:hypothetical protein [Desulfobulbaceae bacterium]
MNYDLPKPPPGLLLLHSFLISICAVAVYLVMTDFQTSKSYEIALEKLHKRSRQLNHAYERVDQYMKFIDTNPYYRRNLGEPQWEKVDEVWVDLSYDDLLQRFAGLYRQDRPFVIDYFSATHKGAVKDNLSNESMTQENTIESQDSENSNKLIFHLQGYFLCPCR